MTRRDFASTARAAGLEALRNSRVVVPLLLDDAAEAVEAGALVAAVAAPTRRNVREIDIGLGMGAFDDGPQPKVAVGL